MIPLYISVYTYKEALDVIQTHQAIHGVIIRQSLLATDESITEICNSLVEEAKQNKIELYIKDNRLLHNTHLSRVKQTMTQLKGHNIGIFAGDPAVIAIAKEIGYDGAIIFAPEMIMTSHTSAQFWLNQGANNVEISHELTFKELNVITNHLEKAPFVQIHGQLSMFQSRRLLVDNYFDHLDIQGLNNTEGQLSLYDKERELHYIITQDDRGTEIYNGQIISIIDLLDRFEKMPLGIIDTYFLTRQKRNDLISLYLEVIADAEYSTNKADYAKRIQAIYGEQPISRGFFLKPTIF